MIRIYAKDYSLQDVRTLEHVLAVAYRECPRTGNNPVTRDVGRALDYVCRLSQIMSSLLSDVGNGGDWV